MELNNLVPIADIPYVSVPSPTGCRLILAKITTVSKRSVIRVNCLEKNPFVRGPWSVVRGPLQTYGSRCATDNGPLTTDKLGLGCVAKMAAWILPRKFFGNSDAISM